MLRFGSLPTSVDRDLCPRLAEAMQSPVIHLLLYPLGVRLGTQQIFIHHSIGCYFPSLPDFRSQSFPLRNRCSGHERFSPRPVPVCPVSNLSVTHRNNTGPACISCPFPSFASCLLIALRILRTICLRCWREVELATGCGAGACGSHNPEDSLRT